MKKIMLIAVMAIVSMSANAQSQQSANGNNNGNQGNRIKDEHDRIVIGKTKDATQNSVRCVRRAHSCGFSVVTPGANGGAVLSYIFPSGYSGPLPVGTYVNDKGMYQRDNVMIKSENLNGEIGNTIYFK